MPKHSQENVETEVKFVANVDEDGVVTAGFMKVQKAEKVVGVDSRDWRLLPIPVMKFITTAYVGWKDKIGGCSDSYMTLGDHDYAMKVHHYENPVLTLSKRCNSNLRSSLQLRLSKLKSEAERIVATKEPILLQIQNIESLVEQVKVAKKTNIDEDWIVEQEKTLVGWDQTIADLNVHLSRLDSKLEENEKLTNSLMDTDLNFVQEWYVDLGEIE